MTEPTVKDRVKAREISPSDLARTVLTRIFGDDWPPGMFEEMSQGFAWVRAQERRKTAKEIARLAESYKAGEQLIRYKMSQVDQVGAVATTIAQSIRSKYLGDGG